MEYELEGHEATRLALVQATRVARELAKAIQESDKYNNVTSIWDTLNLSTQEWVREHEQVDYQKRRK